MIDELQPYPEYVPSGSPWLGAVPSHWHVRSLGSMTSAISRRNRPHLPLLSVVREKGVIPRSTMSKDENHNYVPDDLSNYKVVRAGNLVINKMKAWQGSLGIAPIDGIVSPAYYVFDLAIENRLYGQALLRSRTYVDYFARVSDGVRIGQWDLSINGMRRIPVAVPPPNEQAAIVRFLDHADRRIRRYIRAKQKLIKLLEEEKEAITHQAVTRGLDPSVSMTDSGVEWLGRIPEHWDVALNQRLFRETTRPYRGSDETQLSLSQRDGLIPTSAMKERSLQTASFDKWKIVEPGDLVLNRFKAHLGVFFAASLRGIVTFHYGVFRARRPIIAKYYELLYHTPEYRCIYAGRSNGMTVGLQNLSNQNFYNVRSPVPPVDEQARIVSWCAGQTRTVDRALGAARTEIDLLRELRTRLIADVVTGQLDLRAAAAALPDEPTDDEPLDDADESDADDLDADDAPEDDDA